MGLMDALHLLPRLNLSWGVGNISAYSTIFSDLSSNKVVNTFRLCFIAMLLISKNADLELIPGDMTQPAEN